MTLDKKLEERIKLLHQKYKIYSPEDELICGVSGWIHVAARSLMPNSNLRLAEDKVEVYEMSKNADKGLVDSLWGIVNSAWDIYGEVEVAR